MRKKGKKIAKLAAAFLLSGVIALQPSVGICAAPAAEATIDMTKTGSLTLFKYDMTGAQDAGITESFVADGRSNAEAEEIYGAYAIQGVEFSYLKVGDIDMLTDVDQTTGKAEIKVVYGLSQTAAAALGVPASEAVDSKDGKQWFISDTLIQALSASLSTDETGTKNQLENFVLENGGTTMTETDENGKTSADNLPLGLYLVAETAVPEEVVSTVAPFLVSLPMTDLNGDSWNYDVVAYPKNQTGNPDLKKEVAEVTSAKNGTPEYADTATASDGDIIAYQITSNLARITSEATYLTTYTFLDELSKGISYNKDDVTITWYTSGGEQIARWTEHDTDRMFAVQYQDQQDGSSSMEISMTEAGLAVINKNFSQCRMVIDYTCTLHSDESVVYGDAGNPNEVTLKWQRTNMNYYDTLRDDCLVYTYGLSLTKIFNGGSGDCTQVKFLVKNQTDGYYVTARKEADGIYYATGTVGAAEADATVFSPDAAGMLMIFGLEDDVYLATETETDANYILLKDVVRIELFSEAGEHSRTGSASINSNPVSMLAAAGSANALVPLTVVNEMGYDIPNTGDTNTFLLPVAGFAGAAAIAFLSFVLGRKKKQSR